MKGNLSKAQNKKDGSAANRADRWARSFGPSERFKTCRMGVNDKMEARRALTKKYSMIQSVQNRHKASSK
jgi:hypothetical protein